MNLVDTKFAGNPPRGLLVVARHENWLHPCLPQAGDSAEGIRSDRISERNETEGLSIAGNTDHGAPRCFEGFNSRLKVYEIDATVGEETRIADNDIETADMSNHALSRQRLERINVGRRNAAIERRPEYGLRQRMLG